jgi:hypothetical protein
MERIPLPPAVPAGRPPAARTAAVLAAVVLALLAACGGGTPSSTGGSPSAAGPMSSASAVGYSRCMRSHGVPNFPDPGSDGGIPKADPQNLGVSGSRLQGAQHACQPLLPLGGSLQDQAHQCVSAGSCPPALVQQMETAMRKFAQCMRSHGFPKFPDPTTNSQGLPVLAWSVSTTGIDPHSSQYQTKEDECQRLTGGLAGPREVSP